MRVSAQVLSCWDTMATACAHAPHLPPCPVTHGDRQREGARSNTGSAEGPLLEAQQPVEGRTGSDWHPSPPVGKGTWLLVP